MTTNLYMAYFCKKEAYSPLNWAIRVKLGNLRRHMMWLLSVGRQTIPADRHVIGRLSKCRQETGRQALEWQAAEKLEHRPSEKA